MKLYNKPELNVEAFDVEDIINANGSFAEVDNGVGELGGVPQPAGMEFDINVEGNEF